MSDTKSRFDVPKPFLYLWIALSTIGNLTGIASILDGVVQWVGIFRQYVTFYQVNIRAPLNDFLSSIWLHFVFEMPPWMGDYFVILGAYVTSLALFGIVERRSKTGVGPLLKATLTVPVLLWGMVKTGNRRNIRQWLLVMFVVITMIVVVWLMIFFFPIIHLFTVIFFVLATGKFPKGIYRAATWYVGGTVATLLLVLAMNFQIKAMCNNIEAPDRNAFCEYMMG